MVVVLDVDALDSIEMPSAEDHDPVQTLPPEGAHLPLGESVPSECPHRREDDPGSLGAEDPHRRDRRTWRRGPRSGTAAVWLTRPASR